MAVKYCGICKSVLWKDGSCSNPRCGTGNHVRWPGKPIRKETPVTPREMMKAQVKISKQIDRSCRFLTLEILEDGYALCRCSGCGAEWEWHSPQLVKYCPECGRPVEHGGE